MDPHDPFAAVTVQRKTGDEPLHMAGQPLPWTVLSFWQWSGSDLISNAQRGVLAEFLVACALGETDGVRVEWDAKDIRTKSGLTIEVRSAAYLQSWRQASSSTIVFNIEARRGWDAATNTYYDKAERRAQVYVFALLKHRDKSTLDPLNLEQWDFYVVPTDLLNARLPSQKTMGLSTLRQRVGARPVSFDRLAGAINRAAVDPRAPLH